MIMIFMRYKIDEPLSSNIGLLEPPRQASDYTPQTFFNGYSTHVFHRVIFSGSWIEYAINNYADIKYSTPRIYNHGTSTCERCLYSCSNIHPRYIIHADGNALTFTFLSIFIQFTSQCIRILISSINKINF